MDLAAIGKQIRKYREAMGWRQEDFAEKIGLSVTYTGMIERGEKTPKPATFITVANVLNVSPNLLLADVVNARYEIRSSELMDELETLEPEKREQIIRIIRAMIDFEKK